MVNGHMKRIKLINYQGIKQIGYNMNTYQNTQNLIKLTITGSHKNVEHLDLLNTSRYVRVSATLKNSQYLLKLIICVYYDPAVLLLAMCSKDVCTFKGCMYISLPKERVHWSPINQIWK